MASQYTRSKARRPDDVEPDDVASVATSDLVLDTTFERPSVVAAGEPGSMAAESAGPVFIPTTPSPERMLSSEGGLGTLGPAGSPQVGVFLGYPSGLAGPIDLETQARGQRMFPQPGMETTTSHTAVELSGSGASGPTPLLPSLRRGTASYCCRQPAAAPQCKALQPPARVTAAAEGLTHISSLDI